MDLAYWASELHRNSPQGLNISSVRVFDTIRDSEFPVTLRPHGDYISSSSSVLPKGRSFTANSGTKAEVMTNDRSSIANSGT